MRMRALIAAVALATMAVAGLAEDAPSPGKMQGYFVTNRWREALLVRGGSVFFVSPEASTVLSKNAGKPLEVDVGKWEQQENPGAVRMHDVRGVEVIRSSPDLAVTVSPANKSVEAGKGLTVRVTLSNASGGGAERGRAESVRLPGDEQTGGAEGVRRSGGAGVLGP